MKMKETKRGMVTSYSWLILFLLTECLNIPAFTQDSLTSYLEFAVKNNPALSSKYNEYMSSLEMVPQVGSLPDPELSVSYFPKPKEELMGNQVADIRLMQMFPWFGTLRFSKSEATQMSKAKMEEYRDQKNQLLYNVQASYYQLYRLKKEIEVTEADLTILKSLEQLSTIRYKVGRSGTSSSGGNTSTGTVSPSSQQGTQSSAMTGGMSSTNGSSSKPMTTDQTSGMAQGKGMVDLLALQMSVLELENTLMRLKENEKPLHSGFNILLNKQLNAYISLPDSLYEMPVDSSLFDSIRVNNPMVKMLDAEEASYDARAKKTNRMGFPMVGLGIDYTILQPRADNPSMDNGKDMIMPMLTVTLPIYRKKYASMRRETQYKLNSTKEKRNNTINELESNYQNLWSGLEDARRRVKLYQAQVNLAGQSLGILTQQYQTAGTEFEEVLRMRQKILDLNFKLIEAEVDACTAAANIGYITAKSSLPQMK